MILIFHSLYILIRYFYNIRKIKRLKDELYESKKFYETEVKFYSYAFHDAELNISFDPPVYKQRYQLVQQILLDEEWRNSTKKIVDFGCAEFGLFKYLKQLYGLQKILAVDIDEDLLITNMYKIQPLTVDYLNKRNEKLVINVLAGSIGDPDYRLLNTDVVIAIEIIEHLYPDVLEAVPYNIFSFIKPKVAIFTTPNADFNILFNNFKGIRHYDHKFEWTREQFESWALNIIARFPDYAVKFTGVANGPGATEHLGFCTQIAIFIKQGKNENLNNCTKNCTCSKCIPKSYGICTKYSYSQQLMAYEMSEVPDSPDSYYKLVETVIYPCEIDNRTMEEKIFHEAVYKIHLLGRVYGMFYSEDRNRSEVPLFELTSNQGGNFITVCELRKLLEKFGNKIEECSIFESEPPVPCVIYEPIMDSSSSSSPTYNSSGVSDRNEFDNKWEDNDSDWDDDLKLKEDSNNKNSSQDATEIISSIIEKLETENTTNIKNVSVDELDENKKEEKCLWFDAEISNEISNHGRISKQELLEKLETIKNKNGISINEMNTNRNNIGKKIHSKEPIPGTSSVKKKKKTSKHLDDIDENTIDDDMRDVTECIIINSLNKADDEDEEDDDDNVQNSGGTVSVQNSSSFNKTLENIEPLLSSEAAENLNFQSEEDNEDAITNEHQVNNSKEVLTVEENPHASDTEIAFASREALFDPNSQVDLLEDFEDQSSAIVPIEIDHNTVQLPNVIIIGVHVHEDEDDNVLPGNADRFPNWLLQLLGAEVSEDVEQHDEPHFYCQGDGIGVHPSVIEVDIEEDQSTSESSSNNSNDDAEAEPSVSEPEVVSLPEDGSESQPQDETIASENGSSHSVVTVKPGTSSTNDSADEFYDTVESSSQNGSNSENKT